MKIESRYLDGSYYRENPNWDREDATWKAALVYQVLQDLNPASICDIGCGAGDVLALLGERFPQASLHGFDISPQLENFWKDRKKIRFHLGEPANTDLFDVILMLDVFEHVRDPFTFLERAKPHAKHFVFHIPLDLSAQSVLRETPLIMARRKTGHLHSYTKWLALETLKECGYSIDSAKYTHPPQSLLASVPRRMLRLVSEDLSARLLGGETLIVLAH